MDQVVIDTLAFNKEISSKIKDLIPLVVSESNIEKLLEFFENEKNSSDPKNFNINETFSYKGFPETLLGLACLRKNPQIVNILLENGSDPNFGSDGNFPIYKALQKGCFGLSCDEKVCEIIQKLINHGQDIRNLRPNSDGDTVLCLAVMNSYSRCAKLLVLNGASIDYRCSDGKLLAKKLALRMPDVFLKLLDTAVLVDESEDFDKIQLDFSAMLLDPTEPKKVKSTRKKSPKPESIFLKSILKGSSEAQEKIFSHPVTQAFLFLKWKKFRVFHGLSYLTHLTLLGLYIWFVVDLYMVQCPYKENETIIVRDCIRTDKYNAFIAGGLLICFTLYILFGKISNIFSLFLKPRKVDFFWILALILLGSTLMPPFFFLAPETIKVELNWEYPISALGILLMGCLTLTYIAQSPKGIYVEMFVKVLIKIVWLLILLFSLLSSFGIAFVLMRFDIWQLLNFTHLIVGEPNFDELFQEGRDTSYMTVAIILFSGGIVILSIALLSFITGAAVGELQNLEKEANFVRNKRLIKSLHWAETYGQNRIGSAFFNQLTVWFKSLDIFIFKERNYVTFNPYLKKDQILSTEIKTQILKLVKEKKCTHN